MKNKELNKISMGSQLQPNNFQTLRLFRWTGSHANQNNRASGNYTLKYFPKYLKYYAKRAWNFLRLGCYTNSTLTCLKTGSLLQESASSSKNLDTHASYMSHLS